MTTTYKTYKWFNPRPGTSYQTRSRETIPA